MRALIIFIAVITGAGWQPAAVQAAEAVAIKRPPVIDGALGEWGMAGHLAILPAGDGVGLRGAFNGEEDHLVDVYLKWDAEHIYIAAVVEDDVLDVASIAPDQQEWKGASGQRKDRMFYYDHLKIFLRGPDVPLGYTLWISPGEPVGQAYAWGGRQRQLPTDTLAVRLASGHETGLYTYEVAIPWAWLALYPQSDMQLDGLLLFTDADDPALDIGDKIRAEKSNWIWWKGKIHLRGEPPGLKPPVQAAIETAAKKVLPQVVDQRVDAAIERMRRKQAEAAAQAAAESTKAAQAAAESTKAAQAQPQVAVQTTPQTVGSQAEPARSAETQIPSVSALLNRRLLARQTIPPIPDWVLACNADTEVAREQVDSLVFRLKTTLRRLSRDRINSRTDGLVMDIAAYAGTRRNQARPFLQALLIAVAQRLDQPEEPVYQAVVAAAQRAGIDQDKALRFVADLCLRTEEGYRQGKVSTTAELIKKSRRVASLKEPQVHDFIEFLLEDWTD